MGVNKTEAFRNGSGNPWMRKLLPILAVMMVIVSGAVVLNSSDSHSEGAGEAEEHDVVYHPYYGAVPAMSDTYNDGSADTVSVTCYGSIVSTEYNPQVWSGTGLVNEETSNWYAPKTYSVGNTTVFTGWKYATAFSGNSATGFSDVHYPGEVMSKAEIEAATGPDGKIHIYATWGKVNKTYSISTSGSFSSTVSSLTTGDAYTNILLLDGSFTLNSSASAGVTIRSYNLDSKSTLTIGNSKPVLNGNMFIDNVKFTGYFSSDNHGYDTSGLYANGNILIMGTGIESERHSSASADYKGFPQLFGGASSGTVSSAVRTVTPYGSDVNVAFSTFMIVHSGIYSNIVAGGGACTVNNSAYLVIKDVTILDSLVGGASTGTMKGDSYVYTTAANMPGDTFEETQMGSGDIPAGLMLTESTIFTGGSGQGTVKDTHVYVSGTSRMWDVQGGGRSGTSTAGNTNVEISGKALIKHVVCGSITDGNKNSNDNRQAVKSTNITVKDYAKVGAVYGAGYDTFYEAKSATMMGEGSSISVNIHGGTVGYVYGGGYRGTVGTSSEPLDSVRIHIDGGTILGDVFGGGRGGLDKLCHESDGSYNWGESQGDTTGMSLVYAKTVSIVIDGGTVDGNIYGGGESVPVVSSYDGSTTVGGRSLGSAKSFPSGLGVASVVCDELTVDLESNDLGDVFLGGKGVDPDDVDENGRHNSAYSFVMKADGTVAKVLWVKGSGTAGTVLNETVDYTYYASIQADSAKLVIRNATVGDDTEHSHVYGGGERGVMTVKGDVSVELENSVIHGSVYGAGKGDETKETDGLLTADNVITKITGSTINKDLYGGGEFGKVVGNTAVTIDGGSEIKGAAYGAGLGKVGRQSVTADSSITLADGKVGGDMFGGAAYGLVSGNTSAVFNKGTIGGSLYGGGLGQLDQDSVTGKSSVTMTGGTVVGSLYGGAKDGVVRGGCEVAITGGTVKGSAFGGGQGQAGHQSMYGPRKFRMSDARVEDSVHGGSSYGNDGIGSCNIATKKCSIDEESSVTVVIESGYIGGSVYGGGYEGQTAGNTSVWVGYRDVASPGTSGNIHIGLSIYGSGNVGDITAGQVGYSQYLVLGDADVHFNGKGYGIEFSGGVFGSGNSCLTYGESTIEIVGVNLDGKIDAVHRATRATIESSTLRLNGRTAGNGENENVRYSIYDIGTLEVKDCTSLHLYAPMDNIGSYRSINGNGDLTTYSSPSNTVYLCEGTEFEIRSDSGSGTVYGDISGYTVLTIPTTESYYGAFAFGSLYSDGGFVVQSNGSYALADSASFPNCKCWYRSGIAKEVTSVILTHDGDKGSDEIISSTAKIDFKLLSPDTDLRYTGGYFEPYEVGMYRLVESATPGVNQYSVEVGTNSAGTPSNLLRFNDGACFVSDAMKGVSVFGTTWDGSSLEGVKDPAVEFTVRGPNLDKSMYAGYAILYFQEVSKVTYTDAYGQPQEDYVVLGKTEIKINIYREKIGDDINDKDLIAKTVGGAGSADIMIPRGFRNCDVYLDSIDGIKGDCPLALVMSKNAEANNGWNGHLREYAGLTGHETDMFIGQLNGGHNADLRFAITGFDDKTVRTYVLNFSIRDAEGTVQQTFKATIRVSQMDPVLLTFHDAKQGFERTLQFDYGSLISTANCPTTQDNFVGWYLDEDFINPFNFNNALTSNLTLYACYKNVVIFNNMNGTWSTLQVPLQDGGTLLAKPEVDPVWTGYEFRGWYKDEDCNVEWSFDTDRIVGDTTLYAKWEGNPYDLVFKYRDPTDNQVKIVNIPMDQLTDEEKASLRVTYGGTFGPIVDKVTDLFENQILPNIDGGKYKFVRWQMQEGSALVGIYSDTVVTDISPSGTELVLFADIASSAITVHLNTNTTDQSAAIDTPVSFLVYAADDGTYRFMSNNATRTGYQLVGWSETSGATVADGYVAMGSEWSIPASEVASGGTLELYAVWKKITYEVIIFAPDGGKIDAYHNGVKAESFQVEYGEQITLNYTDGDGYYFSNWYINGEGKVDNAKSANTTLKVIGNCAVYAQLRGLEQVTVNVTVDGKSAPDSLVMHLSPDGQNSYRKFAHTDRTVVGEEDRFTYRTFVLSARLGEFKLCFEGYNGALYVLPTVYVISDRGHYDYQAVNVTSDGANTYWVMLVSVDTSGVTGAEHLTGIPSFMPPGTEVEFGFEEGYTSSDLEAEGYSIADRFDVPNTVDAGPVHLTGTVGKIRYTVHFDTTVGDDVDYIEEYGKVCDTIADIEVEYGGTYPELPFPAIRGIPLRGGADADDTQNPTGLKFLGWYADPEFSTPVNEGDTVTNGDVTLYAKIVNRQAVDYKIQIFLMDKNGNYPSAPTQVVNESGINGTPTKFDWDSYLRLHPGFTYNAEKSKIGDTINRDQAEGSRDWEPALIYFDRMSVENPRIYVGEETAELEGWTFLESAEGNGNYLTKDRIYYGETVTLPQVSKTGYSTAWKLDGQDFTGPVYTPGIGGDGFVFGELVAQYTVNTYKLTIITPYGTLSNGQKTMEVPYEYGESVTVEDPKPDAAHVFGGWDKAVPKTMPAEDVTLTALWTTAKFTLNFTGDEHATITADKEGLESGDQVEYGTQLTLTIVIGDGYVLKDHTPDIGDFVKVNDRKYTWTFTVDKELDVFATSKPLTYGVHYVVDGTEQKDTMCQTDIVPGAAFPEIKGYSKDGYTFDGWYTDSTYGTRFSAPGTVDKDYTLYGRTTPIIYDIVFHSNIDGAAGSMDGLSLKYDEKKVLTANGFSKDGYVFLGWATSENGEVAYLDGVEVGNLRNTAGTVDLYAVWYKEKSFAGTYDGQGHAPSVELVGGGTVYYNTGSALDEGNYTEHTTELIPRTNVHDITVYYFVKSGKATAAGSVHSSITAKPLTEDMVLLREFTYNGKEGTVTVTVTDGKALEKDHDFEVSGTTKGTDAGQYDITVKGIDNYSGELKMKWSIAKKDISGADIILGPSLNYDGSEQTQTVEYVKIGDLVVTFDPPTGNTGKDAKFYTLSVTGNGNFTGTATQGWSIAKKDISDAVIALGPSLTYDGSEQTQTVESVKIGDLVVTFDPPTGNTGKDAKFYTLSVTGNGNFTGTATQSWNIAKKDITVLITGNSESKTYTGSELSVEGYEATCAGESLFGKEKIIHTGNAKASGTGVGTYNMGLAQDQFTYDDTNLNVTFNVTDGKLTVTGKSLENNMIQINGTYVYDGTLQSVNFTVTYGTLSLQSGKDFTVTRGNDGTNAAEYALTITGSGNYSGTATASWNIAPMEIDVPAVKTGFIYNGTVPKIVDESIHYAVTGVTKDAGTDKDATISLVDKSNTIWKGGNSGDRAVKYTIAPKPLENSMIHITGEYVYVPGEQSVKFTVKDGEYELVKDADYEVDEGGSASGVGNYTLRINGLGNYTGSAEVGWSVGLNEIPVPQPVTGTVYDGKPHECVIGGTGYTVEGGSATDAGEHTAKLTLQSGYAWAGGNTQVKEVKYTIAPKQLAEGDVTVNGQFTYNAVEQSVTVSIRDGDKTLQIGTDYAVTGDLKKTAAGTYTVTIEGNGNYSGTFARQWTIDQIDISGATVTIEDPEYDGNAKSPEVKLALDGFTRVAFIKTGDTSGTAAGAYTMTIEGTGNFKGSVDKGWKILPKDLSNDMIQISGKYTFNGMSQDVNFTVSDSGTELVKDRDFRVVDKSGKDAGNHTLEIEGMGNYSSIATKNWNIAKKDITVLITGNSESKTYTGSELSVEGYEATCAGESLFDKEKIIHTGNAKASGTGVGTYNMGLAQDQFTYGDTNLNVTFNVTDGKLTVAPKSLENDMIQINGTYVYDGISKSVDFTVTYNGVALEKGVDYTILSGGNGTEASDYTLTITGNGNYSGTATASWNIAPMEIDVPAVKTGFIYNGTVPKIVDDSGYYSVTGVTKAAGENKTATLVLNDKHNTVWADTGTADDHPITYGIARKELTADMVTVAGSGVYTGGDLTATVTVRDGGRITEDDYTVTGEKTAVTAGTHNVTVICKDGGNYYGEITKSWNISPATVAKPTLGPKIYNGETQKATVPSEISGISEKIVNAGGKAVGTYPVEVTLDGNHVWEDGEKTATLGFQITKRVLRVTADDKTIVFHDADPELTYKAAGFVGDDDGTVLRGELARSSGTDAGVYVINKGTLEADNYEIEFFPGKLTIEPFKVTKEQVGFDNKVYNGSIQKADVPTGDWEVVENEGGTDVGSYAVKIRLEPNHVWEDSGKADEMTFIFRITRADLTVTVSNDDYQYTDVPSMPVVTGADGLEMDFEYAVAGTDMFTKEMPAKVGNYVVKVIVFESKNYKEAVATDTFSITPKKIDVPGPRTGLVYNGTEQYGVAEGVGYTVGQPATDAGDHTASVTLGEGYVWSDGSTDAKYVGFSIARKTLTEDMVVDWETVRQYTGDEVCFATYVKDGETFLKNDRDYSKTGELCATDLGEHKVTLTGLGNYEGTVEKTYYLINEVVIKVPESRVFVYDGTSKNGVDAPDGCGYTIVSGGSATGAGTYRAVLSLVDPVNTRWSGSGSIEDIEVEYVIKKASFTPTVTIDGWTFGDSAKTPKVSGNTSNGDVSFVYASKYVDPDHFVTDVPAMADTYVVKLSVKETDNYEAATATCEFRIAQKEIDIGMVEFDREYVYIGQDYSVHGADSNLELKLRGTPFELEFDLDYRVVSGGSGRDAGDYTMVIEGMGNYIGTVEVPWKIAKATLAVEVEEGQEKVFGEADSELYFYITDGLVGEDLISTFGITGNRVLEGSLSREAGEDVGEYVIGQGTLSARNYDIVFTEGTFTIRPAEVTEPTGMVLKKAYSGELQKASVPSGIWNIVNDGGVDAGSYEVVLILDGNHVWSVSGEHEYRRTFTITPATITVTVGDANILKGDVPRYTYTVDGLVGDDTLESLGLTVVPGCDYGSVDAGGTCPIGATVSGSSDNYEWVVVPGTLSVTAPCNVDVDIDVDTDLSEIGDVLISGIPESGRVAEHSDLYAFLYTEGFAPSDADVRVTVTMGGNIVEGAFIPAKFADMSRLPAGVDPASVLGAVRIDDVDADVLITASATKPVPAESGWDTGNMLLWLFVAAVIAEIIIFLAVNLRNPQMSALRRYFAEAEGSVSYAEVAAFMQTMDVPSEYLDGMLEKLVEDGKISEGPGKVYARR